MTKENLSIRSNSAAGYWKKASRHGKKIYRTVSLAINDLEKRGYCNSFSLDGDSLYVNNEIAEPSDFAVDDWHKFVERVDTVDGTIVYAIASLSDFTKGILVATGKMNEDSYKVIKRFMFSGDL